VTEKPPDKSTIVGVSRLAEMFGESKYWARTKLKEWLAEQEKGGPVRVFCQGKKNELFTTIAVIYREHPSGRDMKLVRKVEELDRDLDHLVRRVDRLTTELLNLTKRIDFIRAGHQPLR